MKLYHGSKSSLEFLERRQAGSKSKVPENELLKFRLFFKMLIFNLLFEI
jgi:hypothetical protein